MSEYSTEVTESIDELKNQVFREFLAKFDKQLDAQQIRKPMSAANAPTGGVLVGDPEDDDDEDDMLKVSPNSGESRQDFVSRCMSAAEGEFPDQTQRTAACMNMWRQGQSKRFDKCVSVSITDLDDSAIGVVKQIADAVADLPCDADEFAHAYYMPESNTVHVTLSDADERSVYDQWGEAIAKVESVKEITGESEAAPAGRGWIRIDKHTKESGEVLVDTPVSVEVLHKITKVEDDEDFTFVMGPVLVANEIDKQGDIMSPEEISKTADDFMAHSQTIGLMHQRALKKTVAVPVRSFVLDRDMDFGSETFPTGSWFLGIRVYNDTLRKKILSGELTGFSIGGHGQRELIED